MLIEEMEIEGVTVLTITSERMDMATGAKIKQLVDPFIQRRRPVVLNMEKVRFVDSSGFGVILSCVRDMEELGGEFKVCCVHIRVRVLFELVRLHRVVSIVSTVEDAVAVLNSRPTTIVPSVPQLAIAGG